MTPHDLLLEDLALVLFVLNYESYIFFLIIIFFFLFDPPVLQ